MNKITYNEETSINLNVSDYNKLIWSKKIPLTLEKKTSQSIIKREYFHKFIIIIMTCKILFYAKNYDIHIYSISCDVCAISCNVFCNRVMYVQYLAIYVQYLVIYVQKSCVVYLKVLIYILYDVFKSNNRTLVIWCNCVLLK